jgi:hypothetical protein
MSDDTKLPVIYVRPDIMMQQRTFTLRAVRATDIEYVPRPESCISCAEFKHDRQGYYCDARFGCKSVKQDGTSFCCAHRPTREES